MAYQIQTRSDTAANWTGRNPVLAQGEAGYEVNTGKLKYGDGATPWNSLAYFGSSTPPAGNNTQIQFNNSGAFGASANLTFSSANSSLQVAGNVQAARFIGSGNALTLTGVTSNVIPAAANTYTLGSPTHQWKSLYVAGNTIYLNNVPLSLGSNNSLSFNGAPVVTTSTNPNATTQISGSINIGGAVVANTLVGNGSRITGISYANIVGAYGNSNVANYMPVYGGVVAASTVKLSTLSAVSGVITVATASSINLGANSKVFIGGGTTGQVLTTNGSGNLSWTSVGSSNAAVQAFLSSGNVTTISTSGAITSNTSVTAPVVTATSLSSPVIISNTVSVTTSIEAPTIIANTITANSISGPITSDALVGNTLTVGNTTASGAYFVEATANSVSLGQIGGQTLSFSDTSGITLAGTGGVTVMGAAGATVTLGGGTSGPILVQSPVTLGSVSNISISGGSAGQVLTTDGSSNLSWTTITPPYGNSNVADYLSSGTVSTDIITSATVTANSVSLSNVSSISYQTASTASLANAVIYSTAFNDGVRQLTSVDFSVVASDGTDRQVSRLLAVGAGAAVVFTQYASLSTAATLGNFTVDLSGGNVNLNVEPLASPLTYLVTATATYE